jgi:hypothetical protein
MHKTSIVPLPLQDRLDRRRYLRTGALALAALSLGIASCAHRAVGDAVQPSQPPPVYRTVERDNGGSFTACYWTARIIPGSTTFSPINCVVEPK